jgi:hypothetical protein
MGFIVVLQLTGITDSKMGLNSLYYNDFVPFYLENVSETGFCLLHQAKRTKSCCCVVFQIKTGRWIMS